MSGYRSYYDYRKNYETRGTNTTGSTLITPGSTSSTATSSLSKPTPKSTSKEDDKNTVSKYTTSFRRFPQPSTVNTPNSSESAADSKISKEMRAKYGPDGYKPKTDPPITYNNKKLDSTPRYNLTSANVTPSVSRSRGTSPVAMTKTDKLYSSTYTPYKSYQLSTAKKEIPGTSTRRDSRDDLSRIGSTGTTVTASIKPGVSRYRTTSTSSIRSSREDLSRIGSTNTTGSSNRGSSLTRRDSSLSRRNSRDELNKLSVPTLRYTGSTSLNRYGSSTISKTEPTRYSRRSPGPTSITTSSRTLSTNYPNNSSSHSRSTSQDFTSLIHKSDDDNTSIASTIESLKNDSSHDEMITITVMTRATSPTPPSSSNSFGSTRSKRSDIARQIQKDIQRPKSYKPETADKEIQSDRTDDTARYSRFSGRSSWNPYLDLKYSSPSYSKYSSRTSSSSSLKDPTSTSLKEPIIRTSSSQSLKDSDSKKSSKSTKETSPVKLPPTTPKSSSISSSKMMTAQYSLDAVNKDFRKSVLNMNQKSQSGDSDSSNKNKKSNIAKAQSKSRSVSIESSSSSSSNIPQEERKSKSESQSDSRTSQGISEILPDDKLFKMARAESEEKPWWSNTEPNEEKTNTDETDFRSTKSKLKHIESGDIAWWLKSDKPSKSPEVSTKLTPPKVSITSENGERAWWLKSDSVGSDKLSKKSSSNSSSEKDFWAQINSTLQDSTDKLAKTHLKESMSSSDKDFWAQINSQRSSEHDKLHTYQKPKSEEDDGDTSSSDELENYVINQQRESEPPLGDRLSPDGIETEKEDEIYTRNRRLQDSTQFISKHTNIDDLLNIESSKTRYGMKIDKSSSNSSNSSKLDDSALQLYKDGDYGAYLDLEASISEQQEEFEGFQNNRKNSIILRTQLSVRTHSIIEKLLNSESRELRRSLFSLKQIFQEDKDLVHEFVQNDGLSCLIKVGTEIDQNYQNYILRALGQLMLYVDGMNGVIEHNLTIQWLYTLIASKYRLVVKTALKLLLVFVEYIETNCILLINAIKTVDMSNSQPIWSIIMNLLKDDTGSNADVELLIYAMTLINKCLNGIPDQDTYYDQIDSLEEQGMEELIQKYMLQKQNIDLDLLRQFQIYEAVLEHEDDDLKPIQLDETIRKTLRNRKSIPHIQTIQLMSERRKSRRHSTGTTTAPTGQSSPVTILMNKNLYNNGKLGSPISLVMPPKSAILQEQRSDNENDLSSSSQSSNGHEHFNGKYNDNKEANQAGVTPALRRRRERAERQRSFIREQETTSALYGLREVENKNGTNQINIERNGSNGSVKQIPTSRSGILTTQLSNEPSPETEGEIVNSNGSGNTNSILKKPWVFSMMYSKSQNEENSQNPEPNEQVVQLNKENSVKDITQKLSSQIPTPTPHEPPNRIGDMSGLIFKAKEGLAKSKSKIDVLRSPTTEQIPPPPPIDKKTESELHWEELARTINRPLNLCDLDFTDLGSGDEVDVLAPSLAPSNGPPPPPPPNSNGPPPMSGCIPPPAFAPSFQTQVSSALSNSRRSMDTKDNKNTATSSKKNKKTVKLFWKEVRDDPMTVCKLQTIGTSGMIWDELKPVQIDTQRLEHLFESRAKDSLTKKQQELNKNKEIIVLDHKRSNAINIGMTKLPPPRTIKTAILKMDATIMNREGIEKLLTMLPTEEERTRIQDAQAASPELPLGSAEQFLLTLASISELPARLKLWAFKLDFECSEREIAEPLMDLKQGTELLKLNKTFRGILSTLLSIGIFLNGSDVKGFQIDYLAKVPEVKDTVHKHSLLHHLCHMVMEKFPESTDLYSEIGAITRVSKVDFDELRHNIQRLETDCKASWDHLKLIAKHDGTTMKVKMSDFLADCAERIILLSIIHRRVLNRYRKFLLWIGVPLHQISDTRPNDFCRIVSEFALEYRTTRERVLQQLEKKANHRERNKTRGKMITDVGKFSSKEERADAELRHVLGTSDISDIEGGGTLPWRRRRDPQNVSGTGSISSRLGSKIALNGDLTDADDEILESLVKTATKAPATRTMPRERKRTRNVDRKSIKRSRTRESMYGVAKDSP